MTNTLKNLRLCYVGKWHHLACEDLNCDAIDTSCLFCVFHSVLHTFNTSGAPHGVVPSYTEVKLELSRVQLSDHLKSVNPYSPQQLQEHSLPGFVPLIASGLLSGIRPLLTISFNTLMQTRNSFRLKMTALHN